MISYAVDGGSVGPHYDQYDVFLLQAEGQREWRTGQRCGPDAPLQEGTVLSILAEFDEDERWVLNPGDMLYLPPGLAHHGIARGECMTYSIGFRAPSAAQLVERSADALLSQANEHTVILTTATVTLALTPVRPVAGLIPLRCSAYAMYLSLSLMMMPFWRVFWGS